MYVFPQKEDIGEWHGFCLIKEGIYENAKIKFIVSFPLTFPKNIPEIKVITPIFNPLIAEDGKVDMNALIPNWDYGEKCQVLDMLMAFKNIFREMQYLTNKTSFNPNAAIMFENEGEKFLKRVEEDCIKSVEDFDNHYQGCPYKHTPREVPISVLSILEDSKVDKTIYLKIGAEEKKAMIIKEIKRIKSGGN